MRMRRLALALLLAAGCSGSGDLDNSISGGTTVGSGSETGTINLVDDGQPTTKSGDIADTVEVEVFDAQGNVIYGPAFTPLQREMKFTGVPRGAAKVEIDYLRNGGFLLLRATVDVSNGQLTLSDPNEQPVDPHTTGWQVIPTGSGFTIQQELGGTAASAKGIRAKTLDYKVKGVCYSPAPINFRNVDAPSIGDLFWDSRTGAFNWFALWGKGNLGDTGFAARNDLDSIRGLGCNTIRTYCMLSRQLATLENGNYRPGPIPNPPDIIKPAFTHKQFLDQCWKNTHQPLHVLVGIPLPSTILYRYGGATQAEKDYWDFVVKETVTELKNHPAVMGFTLFNEIDENRSAWPGASSSPLPTGGDVISGGVQNEDSDYYYGQLARYSKMIKDITGRTGPTAKLVGWAAHENRNFVWYGGHVPAGNPYFANLPDIDFYGVNTYQSVNLDTILSTKPEIPGTFAQLEGKARKPVLLTEWGWAATGHQSNGDQIYEDGETRSKTALRIKNILPQAFLSDLILGVTYFEYSDEWWKEPPYVATEWNGGPADGGMPNGYHDQEGFGLFSTSVTSPRKITDNPYPGGGPALPVDTYTERKELTKEFKAVYGAVK